MTLVTDIETAWKDTIWAHADIKAITNKAYPFEITNASEFEVGQLSFQQKVNFFEYVISPTVETNLIGNSAGGVINIEAAIRYTIEKDTKGVAFAAARNAIWTLLKTVRDELGTSWDSTVDFYKEQQDIPEIIEAQILEQQCWRWVYRFLATKTISNF